MRSSRVSDAVVVFGAPGVIGRRVCVELAKQAEAPLVIAGRRAAALGELARTLPVAGVHVADAGDPAALAQAFAGAKVVINAAGPLRDTASPVLTAALAAGAHYVDVGGEQAVLAAIAERHDAAVRKAGRVALPGAGVDCALGDLAAAWAAAHVAGAGADEGALVRDAAADRLADAQPIDDIAVSYVFDHLALSAGSQRALFQAIGSRTLIWRRDRWEPGRAGDHRRINAGPAFGGEREVQAFAAGDPLTIPRHVAALRVASYLSTTRRARAAAAIRLLSRALPFVPHRVSELLEPYAEPGADYGRTQFAIVAQARRGFAAAQVSVTGHDLYRTTAVIAAWCARRLVERAAGPVGIRAPGELFRAVPALRAIASAAELTIEPSFG
jgi:hypothetical protein